VKFLTEADVAEWQRREISDLELVLRDVRAQVSVVREVRDEVEARFADLEKRGNVLQQVIARKRVPASTVVAATAQEPPK
jgi:hypothetical protein